jgi:hypothetical protein
VIENILNELDQSSGGKGGSTKRTLAINTECDKIKDATRRIHDAYEHLIVSVHELKQTSPERRRMIGRAEYAHSNEY